MYRIIMALIAGLAVAPAFAQEPVGCDKFKWALDRERALLTAPDAEHVANGAAIDPPIEKAVAIKLAPLADAKLPMAPERAPKSPSAQSGFLRVSALKQPGIYRITLSGGAWIDVVQDSHFVHSDASSGALGCTGVRKSVVFDLGAGPFIVQLSGVPQDNIALVMSPVRP